MLLLFPHRCWPAPFTRTVALPHRPFPTKHKMTEDLSAHTSHHNRKDKNIAKDTPQPKPTHFLSIPLGHIPAVRLATERFTSALIAQAPPITGFDSSIIVSARRLHLTLGVMALENTSESDVSNPRSEQGGNNTKTLSAAILLLDFLRPRITEALDGQPLRVPLTMLDIMKPERNDATKAHILYAGPSEDDLISEDGQRLKNVCQLINSEFTRAGFVNDRRPLKLHCTLINTSHRKPRPKGGYAKRVPFSFADICNSGAIRSLAPSRRAAKESFITLGEDANDQKSESLELVNSGGKAKQYTIAAELGTYTVSEIQICRMGSWGAEGEYVCVGKIEL